MNILLVTQQEYPHVGGMSTHIGYLLSGLRDLNIKTDIIAGQPQSRLVNLARKAAALGNRDRYARILFDEDIGRLAGRIEARIKAFEPRLIHCHDVFAARASLIALAGDPRPIVLTVHGPMLYEARQGHACRPRFEARILESERLAYEKARRLIAVDTGQADILISDYGVREERISVIPNSIDVDDVRKLASGPVRFVPPGQFFLVPRRLVPKTGVMYAIKAFSRFERRDAHLVIAGDGPLRKTLAKLSGQLGLSDRVHFLGSIPRKRLLPLYPRAVAVLIPSVPVDGVVEATSLAVLEAMACGTVPIASRIGGLKDLIEDHGTGMLVSPADADSLAEAMLSIADDDRLRQRIIREASAKVLSDHSLPQWIRETVNAYKRAELP